MKNKVQIVEPSYNNESKYEAACQKCTFEHNNSVKHVFYVSEIIRLRKCQTCENPNMLSIFRSLNRCLNCDSDSASMNYC